MKYGFSLVVRGHDATPETFVRTAELAESLEIDSLWSSAHVIVPPQGDQGYAMVPGLKHPEHWKERYWEPFSVLNHLAAKTERVLLGTSVVVLPMHNPFELAKAVAELDVLSNGRFIFGIGVGWFKAEFDVLGQNFRNRGRRTDEALELMRKLWSEDPVTFEGRYYQVEDAYFSPKPQQRPGPPIWVAGGSSPAFRRAARFGDYFHPVRMQPEQVTAAREEIADHCESFGRPRDAVGLAMKLPMTFSETTPAGDRFLTQGTPGDIADGIKRYRDLGVDHFVFDLIPETCQQTLDTMRRFADDVRPKLD